MMRQISDGFRSASGALSANTYPVQLGDPSALMLKIDPFLHVYGVSLFLGKSTLNILILHGKSWFTHQDTNIIFLLFF